MTPRQAIFPAVFFGCILIVILVFQVSNPGARLLEKIVADVIPIAVEQEPSPENTTVPETSRSQPTPPEQGSSCPVSQNYPDTIRQWCSYIANSAQGNGVDPNLIAAVMLQESGGNPWAYSSSGAVGLMQVMPRDGIAATFMCAAGPCFADRPSTDELYDPAYNVSYGAGMLGGLISRYGSAREALRAYGPMDVGYYYADTVLGIFNSH